MNARRAVVTGGAKGLGRAITLGLASDGFDVVALGRDRAALDDLIVDAKELGLSGAVIGRPVDVVEFDTLTATLGALGGVDVLVNNAGIATSAPLERTTLADWDQAIAVNATAAFVAAKAVLPGMRQRGWGRVVTIASSASLRGSRYIAAYTASKHAVLGLMRALAAEVAGTGVTANCVCPAYARTEMTERTVANIVARTGRTPAEAEATLAGALGRLVEPAEVAAAVRYLVSDAAAAVNGQSIVLDGGNLQR
jgi:NAD(P)-dependent dehydrogenase (short-subunit alcohol dehydrogenase family)